MGTNKSLQSERDMNNCSFNVTERGVGSSVDLKE